MGRRAGERRAVLVKDLLWRAAGVLWRQADGRNQYGSEPLLHRPHHALFARIQGVVHVEDPDAGALAGALDAKRMLLLTDVEGVRGKDGQSIRQMTLAEAEGLIADGTATGGMIPKLQTAMAAVRAGVEAVVILDGRRPHAMLVELFTEHGAGTLVRAR